MSKTQTIIVESVLQKTLAYLPLMDKNGVSYKPLFKIGDHKELLSFFKQTQGNSNYPLIWLEMPFVENHINTKKVRIDSLNFILAVETNSQMLYNERLDSTFVVLYKLLDNLLTCFKQSNTISYDLNFQIEKYGNYSDVETVGDEAKFSDIWDAIKLTINLELNNNCLREIKF
jgi:hypothetical protein